MDDESEDTDNESDEMDSSEDEDVDEDVDEDFEDQELKELEESLKEIASVGIKNKKGDVKNENDGKLKEVKRKARK